MKIKREQLLNDLVMVKPGLSPREFIEQSSCFVFQDGMVMSFNDEVACRKSIELQLTGAVQAAPLLAILEKLDDPELKVEENESGELEFRAKGKAFAITKDAEVFLPIDRVEMPSKKDWMDLPAEFATAIDNVMRCVSKDETKFVLTCIHLTPDFIEACDNKQVMRHKIQTGLTDSVLVRGSSLDPIPQLGMNKVALTKNWVHFKNESGLLYSCRKYTETYPELSPLLKIEAGKPIVFPKGLSAASERAAVFATDRAQGDPLVRVHISQGKLRLIGEGLAGWYKEIKKVAYDGPTLEFFIDPSLLQRIADHYSEAYVNDRKLRAVSNGSKEAKQKWEYVTALTPPTRPVEGEGEDEEEEETEELAEKPKKKKKKKTSEE